MKSQHPTSIVRIARSGARTARRAFFLSTAIAALGVVSLQGQEPVQRVAPVDSIPGVKFPTMFALDPLVVTATRSPRKLFEIPAPVVRMDKNLLQATSANNVADLFRNVQGLDVVGVGPSQVRPQIRGQRGQRILLLADGIRLQNSRRQQDFGEIPSVVDVNSVERVEVVKGPASVLYGSDAIGGVVNVITRQPEQEGAHGNLNYRYGSAGGINKAGGNFFGRSGSFDFKVGGSYRDASAYEAPAGSFGDITLADKSTVNDTGVTDWAVDLAGGWQINENNRLFAKFEHYDSQDSGFGWINPDLYEPGAPEIAITYPFQKFNKVSVGYQLEDVNTTLLDRLDITAYGQQNDRELLFNFGLVIPMGPGRVGTMDIADLNHTTVDTYGFRIEAKALAFQSLLWTYGVDYFTDRAVGTDLSTTEMVGFGPFPIVQVDSTPSLPEAHLGSLGAFVQGDYEFGTRGNLIVGARYQRASSETFATPGLEGAELYSSTDDTFVGAINGLLNVTEHWALVGTVGRGFRWPNLVERYFSGSTPEGSGDQIANPDLKAEASINLDAGIRYRRDRVALETFYFRNNIDDAIRVSLVDSTSGPRDVYQNVNVDEFLYQGVEVGLEVFLTPALSVDGNYTWLDSENKTNPEFAVAEGANNKLNLALRWMDTQGRFWAQYDFRHQGKQEDAFLGDNVLGDALPGFDVHNIRGGFRFFTNGWENSLSLTVGNLTDALYAEASNASFFRPEPGRHISLTVATAF